MPRNPKTRNGRQWTEARFFGFLRTGLRQMSVRWHPRRLAMDSARREAKPEEKLHPNQRFVYECASCHKWLSAKQVEVDHIDAIGSLKKFDDLPGFCERLFCEVDGFQVLCVSCNEAKKHVDKANREDANRPLFDDDDDGTGWLFE